MIELRKPTLDAKEDVLNFLKEWNAFDKTKIHGSSGLEKSDSFEHWLQKVNISNLNPIELKLAGRLPQHTFLAYDNNKLIGFIAVRTEINDALINSAAGHIGYSVRPTERRKGYATQMLSCALEFLKQIGVRDVFVGCNINNIGSKKTIEKCGGKLFTENQIEEETNQCYLIKL